MSRLEHIGGTAAQGIVLGERGKGAAPLYKKKERGFLPRSED